MVCGRAYVGINNIEWKLNPRTEFFDHNVDLLQVWNGRGLEAFERGVFNSFFIKNDSLVMELCCGDGFFSKQFYSQKAKKIVAVDYNIESHFFSTQMNASNKIQFMNESILSDVFWNNLPSSFDNIICDAAIDRFTEEQSEYLFNKISQKLSKDGVFSGYLTVGNSHLTERSFSTSTELRSYFEKKFKVITILQSNHRDRSGLFFALQNFDK